jgi:hypothetical protein
MRGKYSITEVPKVLTGAAMGRTYHCTGALRFPDLFLGQRDEPGKTKPAACKGSQHHSESCSVFVSAVRSAIGVEAETDVSSYSVHRLFERASLGHDPSRLGA